MKKKDRSTDIEDNQTLLMLQAQTWAELQILQASHGIDIDQKLESELNQLGIKTKNDD